VQPHKCKVASTLSRFCRNQKIKTQNNFKKNYFLITGDKADLLLLEDSSYSFCSKKQAHILVVELLIRQVLPQR